MEALRFSVNVPQWLALKVLGRANKRLFYSGPLATVKLEDIPEPGLPGPDWVKVKTLRCGFCASDLNLLFLKDSPTASPFTSFPCVMGHEICGEVVETGPDADGPAVGDLAAVAPGLTCVPRGIDPVCPACASGMLSACENYARGRLAPGMFNGICRDTGGGFGQYLVAHKSQIFKLPQGMSPETGALIEPMTVGLQAVVNNLPRSGEKVLVIGGGVIGSLIVQAIRGLDIDCGITVADPSPFAADLSRRAGADQIIGDRDLLGGTVRQTGAVRYKPMMGQDILMGGFARIYDTVGSTATLNTSLRCLAAQGVVSVVGIGHDVKLDLTPLWLKMQTIKGVYGCSFMDYQGERRHMFEVAIDLAHQGRVSLEEMVTHRFALDDFEKMIETNLNKGRHQAVKTVVSFAQA